jgi:septum formation protein
LRGRFPSDDHSVGAAMLTDLAAIRAAHIILASGSPRRVDIINGILQLDAQVTPSTFPEDLDKSKFTPAEYVVENARQKALDVYSKLEAPPSLVIGADTVVVLDGRILENPPSVDAAKAMLGSMSGRQHQVATGVALVYAPIGGATEPDVVSFVETTKVNFAPLSQEVIDSYVATSEPMDKAGSYGIQGIGGSFVTGIEGCFHNAVGFPMHRFCATLDCERLRAWINCQR